MKGYLGVKKGGWGEKGYVEVYTLGAGVEG